MKRKKRATVPVPATLVVDTTATRLALAEAGVDEELRAKMQVVLDRLDAVVAELRKDGATGASVKRALRGGGKP